MTELTQAAKHRDRAQKIAPENIRVELSAETMERFAELYRAVKGKGGFDSENLLSIKEFATVRQTNLKQLVVELPQIAQQAEATGDTKAREALDGVIDALAREKGFMLEKPSPTRSR